MLIKVTRIALVFAALGLVASERGGALTETKDTGRTSRFLGTEGDFVELAQAGNRPPVVRRSIANRRATEGARFSFIIPLNTFADPDGDSMTIRIRENVGWLSANQNRRRLSGRPLTFDNPALVRVRATDQRGASVATTFRVRIRPLTVDDDAPPGQSSPSPSENGTTDSTQPSISADGRFVAHVFENAEPIVPEQSIVVRDFTSAGFSGRGSFTVAGPRSFEPGDASAALLSSPSISADGRIVAFVAQTAPEASVQGVEIRVVRIADSDPLELETKFVQSILRSDDPLARDALVFSTGVSLSADGRLVAFERGTDIVVAKIGTRRRLIIRNGSTPSLSRTGRRIAYEEVTGADERDILVATLDTARMRVTDTTVVGRDTDFGPFSSNPVLSANGNFVVFESGASDLDLAPPDDDGNGARDIFLFNVREHLLRLASVDADGDQADADSFNPSLSADGRLVAFDTDVPNVDAPQVLVREFDQQGERRGGLRIVSVDSAGNPGNLGGGGGSFEPSLSADGRFVTFESTSTNLTEDAADNRGVAVFLAPTFPGCEVEFGILDDPQDNSCTQATLELGTPRQDEIDPAFDADWYRVELIEGQSYRFELQADPLSGTPLGDPFLELRDASGGDPGGVPRFDDDSGGGLNDFDALLDFQAPSSGTFFVVARGRIDETGDYVLSIVTPPPAVTVSR